MVQTVALYIAAIGALSFSAWRLFKRTRFFLHVAQLQGYKPPEYFGWLKVRGRSLLVRLSHVLGLTVLAAYWLSATDLISTWPLVALLVAWSICFASSRVYRREREKKPLVYTPRLKRLFGLTLGLISIVLVAGGVWWINSRTSSGISFFLLGTLVADLLAPLLTGLALIVTRPWERRVHERYKRQARTKLAAYPDLKIIGITGSYGKTSTKFALAEILRQRFNVLASPGSYNTPMGLCLVVNRDLQPEHAILIAEMGARYKGDIAELCELVRPDAGIITNVGVAHIASLGSVENIAIEKGQLAEHASETVVLNYDDPRVTKMAGRTRANVVGVAINNTANADFWATDISYDRKGAHFTIHSRSGDAVQYHTSLLGEHNIMNILMAVATGSTFGLRLRQMSHAVARLQPIEHRLALRHNGTHLVLDDAFNSNPQGAKNAVEVLGSFPSDSKIVVTPGMIELGDLQFEKNFEFGRQMAGNADYVLLVGKQQTRPIQEGLADRGFPEDRISIHRSLWEAQEHLKKIVNEDSVVLYENDLPDQFEERM